MIGFLTLKAVDSLDLGESEEWREREVFQSFIQDLDLLLIHGNHSDRDGGRGLEVIDNVRQLLENVGDDVGIVRVLVAGAGALFRAKTRVHGRYRPEQPVSVPRHAAPNIHVRAIEQLTIIYQVSRQVGNQRMHSPLHPNASALENKNILTQALPPDGQAEPVAQAWGESTRRCSPLLVP